MDSELLSQLQSKLNYLTECNFRESPQSLIDNHSKEINEIYFICKSLEIADFTNKNPIVRDLLIVKAIPQIKTIVEKLINNGRKQSTINLEIIQTEEELINSLSGISDYQILLERLRNDCDEFENIVENIESNNIDLDSKINFVFSNFLNQIHMYKDHIDGLLCNYSNHLILKNRDNHDKLHKLFDDLKEWLFESESGFSALNKYSLAAPMRFLHDIRQKLVNLISK